MVKFVQMRIIQQLLIEIYKRGYSEDHPLTTVDLYRILKRIVKRNKYLESYLSRLLKMLQSSGQITKLRTSCFAYSPNSLDHDFYCSRFCYFISKRGIKRVKYLTEKYNLK